MASNFLQRKIFVLAFDADHREEWHCSMFRPSIATRGRQQYDTGQHVPLQLTRCLEEIRQEKLNGPHPPLVLWYWGEHYSAFIDVRLPLQEPESEFNDKEEASMPAEGDTGDQGHSGNAGENSDGVQGDSQSQGEWRVSQ